MTNGRKTTYDERVEIVKYCIEHQNNYLNHSWALLFFSNSTIVGLCFSSKLNYSWALFFPQL